MSKLFESLHYYPIIASIKNMENLEKALVSPCTNIFLQTGNIFNLKEISQNVKSKDKNLYINIDSIDGFSKDTWGLEYIIKNIELDGIITNKSNLIKICKYMGVFSIEKLLIHDSMDLLNGLNTLRNSRPHCVDILPGLIPSIIETVSNETKIPIIASGLISTKEDVDLALNAGALGVSSSNINTWYVY